MKDRLELVYESMLILESVKEDIRQGIAPYIKKLEMSNPIGYRWVMSNYVNWLMKPEQIEDFKSESERLKCYFAGAGNTLHGYYLDHDLSPFYVIIEFLEASNNDIKFLSNEKSVMGTPVNVMVTKAIQWKKRKVKVEGEIEVILELSDRFKLVKLNDEQACRREGEYIGHCMKVGEIDTITGYSLRDDHNKPHVTLTIHPGKGWDRYDVSTWTTDDLQGGVLAEMWSSDGVNPFKGKYAKYMNEVVDEFNLSTDNTRSNDY